MPTEPARRTASRNTTVILVVLLFLAVVLGVAYYMLTSGPDNPALDTAREENQPAAVPESQTGAAVDPVPEGTTPAAE